MNQDEIKEVEIKEQARKISKIIIRNHSYVMVLLTMAHVIPVFTWLCFMPYDQSHGVWFARSGSLTTILSLIAQNILFFNENLMNPYDREKGGVTWRSMGLSDKLRSIFEGQSSKLLIYCLFFTVVGTIIWGYGDLIWNFFH